MPCSAVPESLTILSFYRQSFGDQEVRKDVFSLAIQRTGGSVTLLNASGTYLPTASPAQEDGEVS